MILFAAQVEDASLDFDGDSGVVGTLKSGEASLHFDVKGQASGGPPGRARASGGPPGRRCALWLDSSSGSRCQG